MRLQVNFDLVVDIERLGQLAIIGTNGHDRSPKTVVTFMLVARDGNELVCCLDGLSYWGRVYAHDSLLSAIFEGDGNSRLHSVYGDQSFLIFTREVEGGLRDPRGYLHATATTLEEELLYNESCRKHEAETESGLNRMH